MTQTLHGSKVWKLPLFRHPFLQQCSWHASFGNEASSVAISSKQHLPVMHPACYLLPLEL